MSDNIKNYNKEIIEVISKIRRPTLAVDESLNPSLDAQVMFRPGAVVTLKTGGPAMVVSEQSTDKACCHWHEESGELNTMWIPLVCLKVKP